MTPHASVPFREEVGFELFEGELDGAGAARLHGLGDELELAARLVDGDAAPDENGEAITGAEAEELGLAAEEDDGELCVGVLEGEVDVAGGCRAAVGDLAFDPEVGVGRLNLAADAGDEGGDGPDATLGLLGGGRRLGLGEEEARLAFGRARRGASSAEAGQRGRVLLPGCHTRLSLAG